MRYWGRIAGQSWWRTIDINVAVFEGMKKYFLDETV